MYRKAVVLALQLEPNASTDRWDVCMTIKLYACRQWRESASTMVVSFLECGNKRCSDVHDSTSSELSLACICNTCVMYMCHVHVSHVQEAYIRIWSER
jgi:hypothetical protein